MFIDDKYVRYNKGHANFTFLVHEVGHYVAAKPNKRGMFNLGVTPFFKNEETAEVALKYLDLEST